MVSAAAKRSNFYIFCAACAIAPLFVPRIPQDPEYHHFADRRAWLGIVNFGDVASNLPFLPVGIAGLFVILGKHGGRAAASELERWLWTIFFAAVATTCLGSGFYHLEPNDLRVLFDRLPIAAACASLTLLVLAERVSLEAAAWSALPVYTFSFGSVVYWYFTESAGVGDLRFWGLAQFFPALAIPVAFALFPATYTKGYYYFVALAAYVLAKLCETFDGAVFSTLRLASGHSLKHLLAAAAAGALVAMVARRTRTPVVL